MKSSRNIFYFAFAAVIIFTVAAEIILRIQMSDSLRYKILDKKLHTLLDDNITVALSSNVDLELPFKHSDGYRITTNKYGERIVPGSINEQQADKHIWIIGDSIAMGFGLNDSQTAAANLAQLGHWNISNLAVDSLGARGILKLLKNKLNRSNYRPDIVFWIFHPSDFIDDERDSLLEHSWIRRQTRRIHFTAARISFLYNFIKIELEKHRLSSRTNRYERVVQVPPEDSPTFQYTKKIIDLSRSKNIPLYIILYPDRDSTGIFPGPLSPAVESFHLFLRNNNTDTVLMTEVFKNNRDHSLYLPGDGHPSENASALFASSMYNIVIHQSSTGENAK